MVIAGILAVIVGIIGIVGRFQLTDEMSKIGMDVCIIAAVVAMVYTLTARRKLHMEFVKLKKKKVYLQSQQEKLKSSKEDIDGIYGEKLTAFTNLQSEYQEFELEMSLPTSEDLETQSLNLAMDTIKELSRSIYLEKGRKIRIRASQIFRELTDGKYIEFYGDEGQSLRELFWQKIWKRKILKCCIFLFRWLLLSCSRMKLFFQLFWMIFSMGRIRISLWQFSGG